MLAIIQLFIFSYWADTRYLVFAVILLPTFGSTSIFTFLKQIDIFPTNENITITWECIFEPDQGAFFVNYMVTASLVGCGMELLRITEIVKYILRLCWSRSKAEAPYIKRSLDGGEFPFGQQYANMVMIFCMNMMYCVSWPLITPFGCLYFTIKHFVDRHNLMYAYKPSRISNKLHFTAINFVILSVVMLQFVLMVFALIRTASWNDMTGRTKVSALLFFASTNIYFSQLCVDTCKKCSPVDYVDNLLIREESSEEGRDNIYLPFPLMNDDEKRRYLEFKKLRGKFILSKSRFETFFSHLNNIKQFIPKIPRTKI